MNPDDINAKLAALERLDANWDARGAKRIDGRALHAARVLMASPPDVLPETNGGVRIEWHAGGVDLKVKIAPDGTIEKA